MKSKVIAHFYEINIPRAWAPVQLLGGFSFCHFRQAQDEKGDAKTSAPLNSSLFNQTLAYNRLILCKPLVSWG